MADAPKGYPSCEWLWLRVGVTEKPFCKMLK